MWSAVENAGPDVHYNCIASIATVRSDRRGRHILVASHASAARVHEGVSQCL